MGKYTIYTPEFLALATNAKTDKEKNTGNKTTEDFALFPSCVQQLNIF